MKCVYILSLSTLAVLLACILYGQYMQWRVIKIMTEEINKLGEEILSIHREKGTVIDTLRSVVDHTEMLERILLSQRKENSDERENDSRTI